jgi:hypothetical protein
MHSDRDLTRRFDALRRADRAAAPDFGAIVRRPAVRQRPVAFRAVLVAATIVLAVGGVRLATRRTRDEVPSVLTWRSPTATLLRTPGQGLLHDMPTLRSSLLGDESHSGDR